MRELTHELSNSTLNSLHEWWVEFDRKVGMHVLYGGLVTAKVCDSGVDVVHVWFTKGRLGSSIWSSCEQSCEVSNGFLWLA